jgi:hypothetical protein
MRAVHSIAVAGIGAALVAGAPAAWAQEDDQLAPLLFLVGTWHGTGSGPYGPYDFETIVQRRGRWLLAAETVYAPDTDQVISVDTWVYGYDGDHLTADLYDLTGAFRFHGDTIAGGARFRWAEGDAWRLLDVRWDDGVVRTSYRAVVPGVTQGEALFEGTWLPGPRRAP